MRTIFIAFIIAIGLGGYGLSELKLANKSGGAPTACEVTELEKGVPEAIYRTLGEHVPVTDMVVYYGDKDKPDDIDYAYYPIVSESLYEATVQKLADAHGGKLDDVTTEEFCKALNFRVLVKTKQFKSVAELKKAIDEERFSTNQVTGMIVNDVTTLKSDEKSMLVETFPQFNESQTVIFEAGRTPTSSMAAYGLIAAAAVIGVLGLLFGIRSMIGR